MSGKNSLPLVIDLDGTLIQTDSLWDSVLQLLARKPHWFIFLIGWLRFGKAGFKSKIAENTQLDVSILPYNKEVIELARKARIQGRSVVLATASNHKLAQAVGNHLDLFDLILGSDDSCNLKGKNKANVLVEKYGEKSFDYVGDARPDLDVWRHGRKAYVVGKKRLVQKAKSVCSEVEVLSQFSPGPGEFLKAIRIHQWVKNLLVFVPLILSHSFGHLEILNGAIAFLSLSFCASGTYLINDMLDLDSDRRHPSKRNRPIASGHLAIPSALFGVVVCFLLGFVGVFFLPVHFLYAILAYLLTTTLYTLWAKQIVMLDTIVLSCLYSIRLVVGGSAVQVEVSYWLLCFSFFIFLCLALIKRIIEAAGLLERGEANFSGRGYLPEDLITLKCLASASCGSAILTLALYIGTDIAQKEYNNPKILILICPLMAYWLGRLLILADRGEVDVDPIYFAIKDQISYIVAFFICLVFLYASYV